MSHTLASIKNINKLEFNKLHIPDFQRPYVWSVKHVRQLWDDIGISFEQNKTEYRLGTIILHQNKNGKLEIVDGQQRLTTLCLILHFLETNKNKKSFHAFLHNKQFNHGVSLKCIKENARELKNWIEDEIPEKELLLNYISNKCSVIEIKVNDISEAFQMFDSQNGRGLQLEAYNLLKAYHIKALDTQSSNYLTEKDKIQYDQDWEKAAKNAKMDYLKQVINEQLYRIRKWARREYAYTFDKKKVAEFKGNSRDNIRYPYQNYINQISENSIGGCVKRFENDAQIHTTQICQPILNGKPFFDYIQNYIGDYKLLFVDRAIAELDLFYSFYAEYCEYPNNRIGDKYLLELYKSIIMLLYDMYGANGVNKMYKLVYAFVYRFRIEKKFVKYDSVSKYPIHVIAKINHSKELLDLSFMRALALSPINRAVNNFNHTKVEDFLVKELQIKIIDQ